MKDAIASGASPAAEGGGGGKEEERSEVSVLMRPPMAAPWAAPVAVTTAASTGMGCFTSQDRKVVSSSLKRAWARAMGLLWEEASTMACCCRSSLPPSICGADFEEVGEMEEEEEEEEGVYLLVVCLIFIGRRGSARF